MTVSDESKEVMKILAEMYANDGIHNGVGTLVDEDDGYAAFNNGTFGLLRLQLGYYTQFKKLYDSWMKAHPDDGSFPISRWAPLSPTTTATGCVSMTCPPTWAPHYFIPHQLRLSRPRAGSGGVPGQRRRPEPALPRHRGPDLHHGRRYRGLQPSTSSSTSTSPTAIPTPTAAATCGSPTCSAPAR